MKNRSWIGVDLDGTLAEYHGWEGYEHIGPPVPKMVERILAWIEEGKNVKIFTARVHLGNTHSDKSRRVIGKWLEKHLGFTLPITCLKDMYMTELWDDRVVQVVPNTGEQIFESGFQWEPDQDDTPRPAQKRRRRRWM